MALVTLDKEGYFQTLSSTDGKLYKIIGSDRIVIAGKEYIWRESSAYKKKPFNKGLFTPKNKTKLSHLFIDNKTFCPIINPCLNRE